MKKFIYTIIALLGILMPSNVWAIEAYVVLSEDGTTATFYYDNQKSERGGININTRPKNSEYDPPYSTITTAIIDASFADYQPNSTEYWFAGCSLLTSINGIENIKTDNVKNMKGMFAYCSSLTSLDVSGFKTENVTNMGYMFEYCSSLTSLDVSGFKTDNVTDMSFMFAYCSSLTSLDLSGLNAEKVESMWGMFQRCSNLTTLNMSGFKTKNVNRTEDMFFYCSKLTSLDLSNFNAENAYRMQSMFYECSSLEELNLSGFKTLNVTDMGSMFCGCTSITTLDLSGFNTSQATSMGYLFYNCPELTTIYVGSGWSIASVTDGNMTFATCEKLVGGKGTKYDTNHLNYDYAHIDGGESNPGYFTDIADKDKEQQVKVEFDGLVLTVEGRASMADALEQAGGRDYVAKSIATIIWNCSETITKDDLKGIDNPNLLIYVQADALAPEGMNNVIVDGKAKKVVLVDAATGNNNFWAPQAFTAESIEYTREFKQTTQKDVSRGWEGICLPFTVQNFTHETHGAIAPFRNEASEYHFWLHQLTEKGMDIATTIEANIPYIISMPNSSAYPEEFNQAGKVTFSAKNAQIPESEPWAAVMSENSVAKLGLIGTYQVLSKEFGDYALNVGEEMDGYAEGSVFVKNYRDIRPFEVYSWHADKYDENAGARFISVSSLFGGNGSTGIIDIKQPVDSDNVKAYNLNGTLLKQGKRNDVMSTLPKGIYIINNKKMVVK